MYTIDKEIWIVTNERQDEYKLTLEFTFTPFCEELIFEGYKVVAINESIGYHELNALVQSEYKKEIEAEFDLDEVTQELCDFYGAA